MAWIVADDRAARNAAEFLHELLVPVAVREEPEADDGVEALVGEGEFDDVADDELALSGFGEIGDALLAARRAA